MVQVSHCLVASRYEQSAEASPALGLEMPGRGHTSNQRHWPPVPCLGLLSKRCRAC